MLRPKVDAAWHLHELTADLDLAAFVLFSSVAGTLGSARTGQLRRRATPSSTRSPHHRRARGLPAASLGLGPVDQGGGMTGRLGDGRPGAGCAAPGCCPVAAEQGLALFDAALAHGRARAWYPVAPRPRRALRAPGRVAHRCRRCSAVWSGRPRRRAARPAAEAGSRGAASPPCPPEERRRGPPRPGPRPGRRRPGPRETRRRSTPGAAFKDLGFDSLTAVELRNRLEHRDRPAAARHPGLRLPDRRARSPHLGADSLDGAHGRPTAHRTVPRRRRRDGRTRSRSSA